MNYPTHTAKIAAIHAVGEVADAIQQCAAFHDLGFLPSEAIREILLQVTHDIARRKVGPEPEASMPEPPLFPALN